MTKRSRCACAWGECGCGCTTPNYAVEAKVRKAVEGSLTVQFDSESGQFFAYVRSFDAAIILARKVAEAAVEVALEAGEL